MHGVAYNAAGTRVYTGNGDDKSVSESDPNTAQVLRTISVAGPVDAIAYDESNDHIYADEDDGTQIFVIDAQTMKQIGDVKLPGHKPEYLAVDPASHLLYQNIADKSEIAVVDPSGLAVVSTFPTPELTNNHPLQFDREYNQIVVGGANGRLSVYDTSGKKKFETAMPAHVDQCDLDQTTQQLACAGGTGITVFHLSRNAAPTVVGSYAGTYHVHTLAFDEKTHALWAAMADEGGTGKDYIGRFAVTH
jgi:WD40 repeat protein